MYVFFNCSEHSSGQTNFIINIFLFTIFNIIVSKQRLLLTYYVNEHEKLYSRDYNIGYGKKKYIYYVFLMF